MSRIFWRSLLIVFVVAWAIYEMSPPKSRDLVQVFQERAESRDETFDAIVARARELEQTRTNQAYANLLDAAGTNNLARYFPSLTSKEDVDVNRGVLHRLQTLAAGQIKLGLDLQGGTSFLVSMETEKLDEMADPQHALRQAIEVLRRRVDRFGVAEPIIQPAGENRILIQLPGLSEAEKESARETIQKAAYLEFRLVHPESEFYVRNDIGERGYEVLTERRRSSRSDEEQGQRRYLVSSKAERGLTGKFVTRSVVIPDPVSGSPKIHLQFNSEGGSLFADITRANVNRQLAIVLDGELYSAPNINEPITGGSCEIKGDFTIEEAYELANVLQNPLEAPVQIEEERGVDPSLGKDSIQSGIRASLIGLIAVSIFMLVYYLFAGLVANVALLLNVIILMGVMCSVDATLTLPGIAGIVLTMGMAVDANVLIFERIREEAASGKSFKGALSSGYSKAFSTIFDANITTLIASVILIYMGTGPVQGFGVTLTIGVCTSLFTALVVTRVMFDVLLMKGLLRQLPMLQLVGHTKINFLKVVKPAFVASWLLILIGIGWGIGRGKGVLGVDFAGGDQLGLRFEEKISVDQVRASLGELGINDATIQYQRDIASGAETLQVTTETDTGAKVEQHLKQAFPQAQFTRVSLDQVGATVGREIQRSAIVATLLALFGILIYVAFRYEFSFAVGAVVAVIHDVLMTMGWFFLSGRELSAPIVAAVLTIIGFSINDTIVIFDRIREDLKLGIRGTFTEIINYALNQTLSRTIITSGTVFLATLSLYVFGGGAINDFAFTFLAGVITGTYSSIYIASALVLWWHKGHRPKLSAGLSGETAPAATAAAVTP
ncbi:MAG: protein translocase subunit SecD [Verrucomicrobiales bacterium]|nr:protein translocase subunit SecD [Verrucomicrobiales bacterium]